MKKYIIIITLFPILVIAQKSQSFYIETSIFRNNYYLRNNPELLKLHSNPNFNQFAHRFSTHYDSSWRTFGEKNGKPSIQNSQYPGFIQSDYQQIAIGKTFKLKQYRKAKITHSIGIAYSLTNTEMGNLWQDRYSNLDTNFLGNDTVYHIKAYHRNKRLGINYNIEFNFKIKKFEFGIGNRVAFHYAFMDKTYLLYKTYLDNSFDFDKHPDHNAFVLLPKIDRLFKNDKPNLNKDYLIFNRKPTLFFDWVTYLKLTYNFHDNISSYISWGLTPYARYYRKAQYTSTTLLNSQVAIGINIHFL